MSLLFSQLLKTRVLYNWNSGNHGSKSLLNSSNTFLLSYFTSTSHSYSTSHSRMSSSIRNRNSINNISSIYNINQLSSGYPTLVPHQSYSLLANLTLSSSLSSSSSASAASSSHSPISIAPSPPLPSSTSFTPNLGSGVPLPPSPPPLSSPSSATNSSSSSSSSSTSSSPSSSSSPHSASMNTLSSGLFDNAVPRQDVAVTRTQLPNESYLFHFDTHRFVKNLVSKGFTEQQAEAVMIALSEATSSSIIFILKNAMLKSEQEHFLLKYQSDLLTLRKEMQILEKSEFAILRNESEKAKANMDKITEQLREEIDKLKAGVRLDFSLEKSRIREDTTLQEHKIKDTNNRIDTEIAGLRTLMESMKLDIVKFIAGTVISGFTLILGYIRFFKS